MRKKIPDLEDMMEKLDVYIELHEGSMTPAYANFNDAGADVFTAEDMVIRPMQRLVVPLNFKVALPDHVEMQVRPRSGLSLKTTLSIPNSPGTVDAGYRDFVGVIVQNTYNIANLPYEIAENPELLGVLSKYYTVTDLSTYFKAQTGAHDMEQDFLDSCLPLFRSLGPVILDQKGNPYGTIYIEKGMKIAQLVFNEYRSANFIPVDSVDTIGYNRGGGFGSTDRK
jgi:dUTP pyrophosphatase